MGGKITMEGMGKMKVLVTGSRGYIGRVLTRYLLNKKIDVVGADNLFFQGANFTPGSQDMTTINKDIRDMATSDFEDVDAVIHLAGLSNDSLGYLNPELTHKINYEATVRLGEISKAAGVRRFIFSSSCSMYGLAKKDYVTEEDNFNPQTPYAESKVLAEKELSKLATNSFSTTFLRNSTVFGLSPRMRLDLVVNNLVANAMLDGVIRITSDGTPWRPLVHIQDVCQAFYKVLIADPNLINNQAFNVGRDDNNIQIKNIALIVSRIIPNTRLKILGEGGSDTRSYKVSFEKISFVLGYKAEHTVKDGVIELYKYFSSINFSKNDFNNPLYTTLSQVKLLIDQKKIDNNLYWKQ